jgi:hypothetical protein
VYGTRQEARGKGQEQEAWRKKSDRGIERGRVADGIRLGIEEPGKWREASEINHALPSLGGRPV